MKPDGKFFFRIIAPSTLLLLLALWVVELRSYIASTPVPEVQVESPLPTKLTTSYLIQQYGITFDIPEHWVFREDVPTTDNGNSLGSFDRDYGSDVEGGNINIYEGVPDLLSWFHAQMEFTPEKSAELITEVKETYGDRFDLKPEDFVTEVSTTTISGLPAIREVTICTNKDYDGSFCYFGGAYRDYSEKWYIQKGANVIRLSFGSSRPLPEAETIARSVKWEGEMIPVVKQNAEAIEVKTGILNSSIIPRINLLQNPVTEVKYEKISTDVIDRSDAYLIEHLGKDYAQANLSYEGGVNNGESGNTSYSLYYSDKKISQFWNEKTFTHIITVSVDGKIRATFGLPNCATEPSHCDLNISLEKARSIASSTKISYGKYSPRITGNSICSGGADGWYWNFGAPFEGPQLSINIASGKTLSCNFGVGDH